MSLIAATRAEGGLVLGLLSEMTSVHSYMNGMPFLAHSKEMCGQVILLALCVWMTGADTSNTNEEVFLVAKLDIIVKEVKTASTRLTV